MLDRLLMVVGRASWLDRCGAVVASNKGFLSEQLPCDFLGLLGCDPRIHFKIAVIWSRFQPSLRNQTYQPLDLIGVSAASEVNEQQPS